MKKIPKNDFENLKDLKGLDYPFNQNEIANILNKGYYKNPKIIFSNLKRLYMSLSVLSSIIAITVLGLLSPNLFNDVNTNTTVLETREENVEYSTVLENLEKENKESISSYNEILENLTEENYDYNDFIVLDNNEKPLEMGFATEESSFTIIQMVPADSNENIEDYRNFLEPYKRIHKDEVYILELTQEEFNNIVPNSFISDTLLYIYQELIFDYESTFDYLKLDELGYKKSEIPFFTTRYTYVSPSYIYCCSYLQNDNRSSEEFTLTNFVGYTTIYGENALNSSDLYSSLLFKYSENPIFIEYYNLNKNMSKLIWNLYQNNDEEGAKKIHQQKRELETLIYDELLPIKVDLFDNKSIIFWFYPNDEFLELLPERYRSIVKSEVNIKKKLDNQEINLDDACEILQQGPDLFQLCGKSSGALLKLDVFPNPTDKKIDVSLLLDAPRNIVLKIHDLNGNVIMDLNELRLNKGSHKHSFDLDNLPAGLYLLVVQSNKNEKVSARIVKEK